MLQIPIDEPSFGYKLGNMGILKTVFVNCQVRSDSLKLSIDILSIFIQTSNQLECHWMSELLKPNLFLSHD